MSKQLCDLNPTDEAMSLAKELLDKAKDLSELKPEVDIQGSLKGLGAVVRELDAAGGTLSPSELAKRTCVSDARIANILRVLQERGLVERKQSTGDKRRAEISLTQKGIEDCETRKAELERGVASFLTRLGDEDSRELIRLLGRVYDTITDLRSEGFRPRPPLEDELAASAGNEA